MRLPRTSSWPPSHSVTSSREVRYCACVRYFNLAGECNPDEHYMLPAAERLPGARQWVERRPDPLREALVQFDGYLDRFRLETGTLIIFDRRKTPAPVRDRSATMTVESPAGRSITLLRR